MTHQERVAKAAIQYRDAKKEAKLAAKAAAKLAYLQVYAQKKAEAYAIYSAALMQSTSEEVVNIQSTTVPSVKKEHTISELKEMSMDDIAAMMESEDEELHTDDLN